MGIDKRAAYMYRYGFGEPTGIDRTGENAGILPSREWKAKHRPEPWYPGETVIAGIGQGYWVATTLQLAQGTAALAADGVRHRPHLARDRRDGFRSPWTPMSQPPPTRLTDNLVHIRAIQDRSEEHTSELQSLMRISYAVFCLKKKIYIYNNTFDDSSYTISLRYISTY